LAGVENILVTRIPSEVSMWYCMSSSSVFLDVAMTFSTAWVDILLYMLTILNEIRAPLGYSAASSGNTLPTFQDNVLVPSSRVKKSKKSRKPVQETLGLSRERRRQEQPMAMHLCGRGKGSQTEVLV
jgi:hypothetical protein